MSLIPFPDVPNLPGVPAIPRSPNFPPSVRAGLGLLQGIIWRSYQVDTRWGIFDSTGKALGDPASFSTLEAVGLGPVLSTGSVDYSKETRVSDYPLEKGGFASYNKVELPANPKVTLCFGGSVDDRRAFLEAIDAASKSIDLYSVVTPEVTYIDYAVDKYDYQRRRGSGGVSLLIVEISLREIRQVSSALSTTPISAPKDASATPQVDNGKVQGVTPDQSTLKGLANKLPGIASTVGTYLQKLGQ